MKLGMWLIFDADVMTWSWQGIVLANLAGLGALSFWLGSYFTEHKRMRIDLDAQARKLEVYEKELTLMRSAYHHASGFLTSAFPDTWKQFDFSRNREQ